MNGKAGWKEWLLVLLSFAAFVLGIVSIFLWNRILTIELFTVQAVFAMLFAALGGQDRKALAERAAVNELTAPLEEARAEAAALKKELEQVKAERDTAMQDADALRTINHRLEGELEAKPEPVVSERIKTVLYDEKLLDDNAPVNLVQVARDTVARMKSFADDADIRVNVVSAQPELMFRGSCQLLEIMMRNIVDNSIKYMLRPGKIVITLSDTGDDIFIICKDDGRGLAADELKHIFDLNFQGSNRVSGNGLGLTQAKDIVEAYDGMIYAKSAPGAGMGIYIQLPKKSEGGQS